MQIEEINSVIIFNNTMGEINIYSVGINLRVDGKDVTMFIYTENKDNVRDIFKEFEEEIKDKDINYLIEYGRKSVEGGVIEVSSVDVGIEFLR